MKRLVLIHSGGVMSFGCTGCVWTFPVQQSSMDFSKAEVSESFRSHHCGDPRFRQSRPEQRKSEHQAPAPADNSCATLLRDLCGLKGALAASIELLSSNEPGAEELTQIKAEVDRLRSLLWLHLHGASDAGHESLNQVESQRTLQKEVP